MECVEYIFKFLIGGVAFERQYGDPVFWLKGETGKFVVDEQHIGHLGVGLSHDTQIFHVVRSELQTVFSAQDVRDNSAFRIEPLDNALGVLAGRGCEQGDVPVLVAGAQEVAGERPD